MEKESIDIKIEAHVFGNPGGLHDYRTITVQSTRAEVIKKLDEICSDINSSFEQ